MKRKSKDISIKIMEKIKMNDLIICMECGLNVKKQYPEKKVHWVASQMLWLHSHIYGQEIKKEIDKDYER